MRTRLLSLLLIAALLGGCGYGSIYGGYGDPWGGYADPWGDYEDPWDEDTGGTDLWGQGNNPFEDWDDGDDIGNGSNDILPDGDISGEEPEESGNQNGNGDIPQGLEPQQLESIGASHENAGEGSFLGRTPDPSFEIQKVEDEAVLSPENPVAVFEDGVMVDMGGALETKENVTVTSSSVTESEAGNPSKVYNISMGDGGRTDVPSMVAVTLPLEESWDPEFCFVEVYDEESDGWVPVYTEQSKENKTVTFYPDHFTPYRVSFWDRVKNAVGSLFGDGSAVDEWPLYSYLSDDPTPTSLVYMDKTVLKNRLERDLSRSPKAKEYALKGDYAKAGFDLLSFTGDAVGGTVSFLELMEESTDAVSAFNDTLGDFGNAAAFVQLFYEAYKEGSFGEAFKSNWETFAKMAWDYALKKEGTAAAATVTRVGNILWLMKTCGTLLYEEVNTAVKLGGESEAEYAYIGFTLDYVGLDTGNASAKEFYKVGSSDPFMRDQRMGTSEGNYIRIMPPSVKKQADSSLFSLKSLVGLERSARAPSRQMCWTDALDALQKTAGDDDAKKLETLNNAIDAYCRAFWEMDREKRDNYLSTVANSTSTGNLMASWKEPTEKEKEEMISNLKKQIYGANRDVFAPLLEKCYTIMSNAAYDIAKKQESYFNETLTFTLRDIKHPRFQDSAYAEADYLKLPQKHFKEGFFTFNKDNNWEVRCTRYSWLLAGCPNKVEYSLNGKTDSVSFTVDKTSQDVIIDLDPDKAVVDVNFYSSMGITSSRLGTVYENEIPRGTVKILQGKTEIDIPAWTSTYRYTVNDADGNPQEQWRRTKKGAFKANGNVRNDPRTGKDSSGRGYTAYTVIMTGNAYQVESTDSYGYYRGYRVSPRTVYGTLYLFDDNHRQMEISVYGDVYRIDSDGRETLIQNHEPDHGDDEFNLAEKDSWRDIPMETITVITGSDNPFGE